MATVSWIGGGGELWTNPTNWSSGQVPSADDTAFLVTVPGTQSILVSVTEITQPGGGTTFVTASPTVASVVLDSASDSLEVSSTLTVTSGLTIEQGSMVLSGTVYATDLSISATGTLTNDGLLVLSGTVSTATLDQILGIGTLDILGTIENAGGTLDGSTLLQQNVVGWGTIEGGTIADVPMAGSLSLDGVTVLGNLVGNGDLAIRNGLTFIGPEGTGPAILGFNPDRFVSSRIEFVDSGTLANVSVSLSGVIVADSTLTIASDVSVTDPLGINLPVPSEVDFEGVGSIINRGTIFSTSTYGGGTGVPAFGYSSEVGITNASFQNFGIINDADDSPPIVYPPGPSIHLKQYGTTSTEITATTFDNEAGGIVETGQDSGSATIAVAATVAFTNDGVFSTWNGTAATGGTIDIAAPVAGSGTIAIDKAGVVILGNAVDATQTIAFTGGGTLMLDQPNLMSGEIVGFNAAAAIVLSGISATAISYSTGDLKLQDNDGTFDLAITGDHTLADFVVASTGTNTDITLASAAVPCLAAGSRIATPSGPVAVEHLRVGDTVVTASGGSQAIQWIGHRHVDCSQHPEPSRVWPIRVAAHAFGEGRPTRALLLSPDHAVFIDDALIPVKFLLTDNTIVRTAVPSVTYFHIELPRHDVLMAEDLPVESYLETGGRSAFANGGGSVRLHPDFTPDHGNVMVWLIWEAFGYAPLLGDAGQLGRIQADLRVQAERLRARSGERHRRVGEVA